MASKVILIGIDSATWRVIRPLVDSGRVPAIARLMEGGVSGPLQTFEPTLSPLVWTTIVTGKSPKKHGIRSLVVLRPMGRKSGIPELRPTQMSTWGRRIYEYGGGATLKRLLLRLRLVKRVPVSSNMRRVKALWNIFSESGRPVAVLNWPTTWPADRVNGCMISQLVSHAIGTSARSHRCSYPEELMIETAPFYPDPQDITVYDVRRFFEPTLADMEEMRAVPAWDQGGPRPLGKLKSDYLLHEYLTRAGTYCQMRYKPDFLAVLLSVDVVQHFFWHYMESQYFEGVRPEDIRKYGQVIDRYHVYIDGLVRRLVRQADRETLILIVSGHGHGPSGELPWSGRHDKGQSGIIIASGPGIRRGGWIENASVYDVAPTVLAAVGLPVASDFDGRVLDGIFTKGYLADRPPKYVDTYETGGEGSVNIVSSDLDEEVLHQLKGLGYFEDL